MNEELKLCPLCPVRTDVKTFIHPARMEFTQCLKCGLTTSDCCLGLSSKLWNTRPIEDKLKAEIKKLTDLGENLPAYLHALVRSDNGRLCAENARLKKEETSRHDFEATIMARNIALTGKLGVAKEALEWYADEKCRAYHTSFGPCRMLVNDDGDKARECLKKLGDE